MISIGWYSVCNFIAGFAPEFWFLFLFRALLGIGMGAEWPCGSAASRRRDACVVEASSFLPHWQRCGRRRAE
jgi:MFS family permease